MRFPGLPAMVAVVAALHGEVVVAATQPTILLVVPEKVMGVLGTAGFEQPRQVEAVFARELLERGFAVVDLEAVERVTGLAKARQLLEGDELTAREVAVAHQAEYLLVGTASSRPAAAKLFGSEMRSVQGTVSVRLIRSGDGRLLGSASAMAARPHIDEVQGGMLALAAAAEQALTQLEEVVERVRSESFAGPAELRMQVKGLFSFRHLDYLMRHFGREVPGVVDVRLVSFHEGLGELALTTRITAETLAQDVAVTDFGGFRLRVTHVAPGRLELEVMETP